MLNKDSFKNPELWLEKHNKNKLVGERPETLPSIPEELWRSCPACRKPSLADAVTDLLEVCPQCGHHFNLSARKRIDITADEGSFIELFTVVGERDVLKFPGYKDKLESAKAASGEEESVICGKCTIGGYETVLCVMEPAFMMGSMGRVTGERITMAFEMAVSSELPVVVFCASGGARMQEGMFSLMQMAKTSGAVKFHSLAGLFYLSVITNPTTGGVTASFAMEGDVIIAEPGALIGFAGPRVIEQTIRQKLPEGFQSAEFVLSKGFLDAVVQRKRLKTFITSMLKVHS
ncbi:MAG: acetyl-CoA carboxylase, carboxyltransferase subunit beta [Eubacteriales bacterium]|nr:acetyl-CoA carboxylase, carboxyltransferase subunit beta [Eubacteriales bacterium]